MLTTFAAFLPRGAARSGSTTERWNFFTTVQVRFLFAKAFAISFDSRESGGAGATNRWHSQRRLGNDFWMRWVGGRLFYLFTRRWYTQRRRQFGDDGRIGWYTVFRVSDVGMLLPGGVVAQSPRISL